MLFWSGMMLTLEAARVVGTRFQLMAQGKCTIDECFLMVSEKLGALEQARAIFAHGGDPALIVENYRKIVAANVARLSRHESARTD